MDAGCAIKDEILAFYESLVADTNHRYRSWEHCYSFFRNHVSFKLETEFDVASLHLAFYLASWGMYRGSSALLWKDYKIHIPVVKKLTETKYAELWTTNLDDESRDADNVELISKLYSELRQIYRQQFTAVNGKKRDREASEILITKILLGTVGCTPACDRFFIQGFRRRSHYSKFSKQFLLRVFQFYGENAEEFKETQNTIRQRGGIEYPAMKLIDMYFWNLGVKHDPEDVAANE
jgi:hypothetical protein